MLLIGALGQSESPIWRDNDRRLVLNRAVVFAVPTAGAFFFIYFRYGYGITYYLPEFNGLEGADFVTDKARFLLFPGQAFLPVDHGRSGLGPNPFFLIQMGNSVGRANQSAVVTFGITKASPGNEGRTKKSDHTGLKPDGLQSIGRTGRHAFSATYAS